MNTATRTALVVALALVTGVIGALPSCAALPGKTCYGEHANKYVVDGGGLEPRCTRCLQAECCDLVGSCEEESGCLDAVKTAHACVLDRGPVEESSCTSPLGGKDKRGRQLYDCMRKHCGADLRSEAQCGISNCNADTAIVLIGNSPCDQCLTGACCHEINECYQDRHCKLAFECIVEKCVGSLGLEMRAFTQLGTHVIDDLQNAICAGKDLATSDLVDAGQAGNLAGACVQECLATYVSGGGTPDGQNARCSAYKTYACGAKHDCGPHCIPLGGDGHDAAADSASDAANTADASAE